MNNDTGHTIYLNKKGLQVPSVTTILKILNKPALIQWANKLGFERKSVKKILAESSALGTLIHKLIECYLLRKYVIYIQTDKSPKKYILYNYINNFIDWYKKYTIEVLFMEKSFSSDKFGGTIDFYGLVNGKKTIVDFKTSKGIYSSMFLQLAGYCILLEENNYDVEQVMIVSITDTKYQTKCFTRKELNKYIITFRLLLDLYIKWALISKEDWNEKIGE